MKNNKHAQAGDILGMVIRRTGHYELIEIKITGIEPGRNGGLLKTTMVTPYTVNEVADNTALLIQDRNIILVRRPFLTVPQVRARVCRWINWANAHPDAVRSVLRDPVIHTDDPPIRRVTLP